MPEVEILSIPEEIREGVSSLANKLAIAQKIIMDLEKKNETLKQKLFHTMTLLENSKEQIWSMYQILDKLSV